MASTGLAFKIPKGYFGLIKARSSQALKGLEVGGGVIDSGYVGEVKLILYNVKGRGRIEIEKGERVAQILFIPVLTLPLVEVDELSETERGNGGFGSTGSDEDAVTTTPQRGRSKRQKRINGWKVKKSA
jgi:dUTP pyrophosphatase